jgi:hypothetical protein
MKIARNRTASGTLSIVRLSGIFVALFLLSCGRQATGDDKKKVQDANTTVEKQKGQFDPAFQKNPKSSHFAAKINFDNGVFQLDPTAITKRAGRLPYGQHGGGDLMIEYRDSESRSLGKYFIQNPMKLRSCDTGSAPFTKAINKGSFELFLPANPSITTVEFFAEGKSLAKLSVPLNRLDAQPPKNP